ncbi:MAG: DUF1015 domain-containing protein [Planctomycetales bacterium]|nr:DUF1015 domain-containing protein [Planctomycetales bacterium]
MPQIQAFRGVRYDLGHVGALSDVIAPPYDVIDNSLQNQLYDKHPANVIRLILNRDEPGDDGDNNRYSRAAKFLRNWRKEGVLYQEADPAIYVYHQVFDYADRPHTRRGFMCRTRLERFGEGSIYPHEETHASAKEDRLKLTRACRTNLSQIFGLYPDPDNEAQDILEEAIREMTPVEAVDHLGVVHRIWTVTDINVIGRVTAVMAAKPTFIADGHHRYETACNYRDELAQAGTLHEEHPANYVLMMCVSMSDPGMIVLPTHRLFRGLPPVSSDELIAKLGDCFTCRIAGEGTDLANPIWEQIEMDGDQGQMAFYSAVDSRWVVARITSVGRERMEAVAADRSADWQGLGVSILHRLVMDNLLGASQLPKPEYVHLVEELVDFVNQDSPTEPEYNLAVMVMPATIDHIRAISEHGERMPAKSTYFYPKLLSGLVFNPLEP